MKEISILIVEDEKNLRERLVKYISIFCEIIYEANNGIEALEIYNEYSPDIILTDINMPKLRGVEFIEEIRKKDQKSQVIILSAHTHTQDFLKIVPLNLVNYLVKPVKMDELKEVIFKAIANISNGFLIELNNGYSWDEEAKILYKQEDKIELTNYESAFLNCLISKINQQVSYEELHYCIYDLEEFSQDALFTLVKRIRKKTKKEFVKSCFKFGYKIESK